MRILVAAVALARAAQDIDIFPEVRDFVEAHEAKATPSAPPHFDEFQGLERHGLLSGGSGASYVNRSCAYDKVRGFSARRVLLLTHSNASLFDVDERRVVSVLAHERNARFRGSVPTAEGLWVVTSPMGAERDELWLLGGKPGVVRKRLVIPGTYDAHDAVCVGDAFWLVDTFHGRVLKLKTPDAAADELEVLRELPAWSRDEHINQVGVSESPRPRATRSSSASTTGAGRAASTWSLAHDLHVQAVALRRRQGRDGMALWRSAYLVHLDSAASALSLLSLDKATYTHVWRAPAGTFLKGLAVIGDVAYFGASPESKSIKERLEVEATLVAVDLAVALANVQGDQAGARRDSTVFRVPLAGRGLLNQVVAPNYVCAALGRVIQ
ncbi:aspartyl/asparaginyl beta-hydroxylase [Aureococcus anophagefferens]|nr:aspartyl/asparaginyl beta-hydroxylase [Aureococcus anophagefferens]